MVEKPVLFPLRRIMSFRTHHSPYSSSLKPILLRILLLFFQGLWLGEQSTVGQQDEIIVGRNVQVSKARGDLVHNEVLLSADPTNASRLLGCSMAFSPEQNKDDWLRIV